MAGNGDTNRKSELRCGTFGTGSGPAALWQGRGEQMGQWVRRLGSAANTVPKAFAWTKRRLQWGLRGTNQRVTA